MVTTSFKVLNDLEKQLTNDGKDVVEGLTKNPKTLPAKYFYDDLGSELFEQICELPEYYPTRTEAWILQQYASEIAQLTGNCELVELGSGSSTKTLFLLDAYQKIANRVRYVPIDVSGGILKASVLKLQEKYPSFSIEGLIGTYQQALVKLESTPAASRMIFFLGSSIGNFPPQECSKFLQQIAKTLQPGDYFLLGVDLQKTESVLVPAYNDSQGVTAAFNLNMLSHLNWRFQGNFDLNLFSHQAIYNQEESRIEMNLHCHQDHWVSLKNLDLKVPFKAGESIRTEISRKFNLEDLQTQLQTTGLETVKVWTDPKQWFGLVLCKA